MRSMGTKFQRTFEVLTEGSWLTYLTCGTLAVLMSWVMSGCRIGNRTQNTPPSIVLNFYEMAPQKYSAHVQLKNVSAPVTTDNMPISAVPTFLTNLLSNPIGIQVDSSQGRAALFNPAAAPDSSGNVSSMGVNYNVSNNTYSMESTADEAFNTNCSLNETLSATGAVNSTDSGTSIGKYSIAGHNQLVVKMDNDFTAATAGGCDSTMTVIMNCYNDATQCQQTTTNDNLALQGFFQDLFAPYIQSNLITSNQIQDVTSMGFQLNYQ